MDLQKLRESEFNLEKRGSHATNIYILKDNINKMKLSIFLFYYKLMYPLFH